MTEKKHKVVEGYADVPGGKVWYKIMGEGDGLPLITLHGGPGSTHNGFSPLEALTDERKVIFYDQLGCGKSDRPDDVSLWNTERFVQELAGLREALGFSSVHILGHSWGTMLATDYLLTKPKGVQSVIMSSPCISIPMWVKDCQNYIKQLDEDVQTAIELHQKNGTTDSPEYQRAVEEFNKKHVNPLYSKPEIFKSYLKQRGVIVYETMWGINEFYMTGNLAGYDRTERLHEIKIPTLFSCGRVDEATPETTGYYHTLVPGSEFMIYENSAHMPHWDEPERYIEVVSDFMRRNDPDKSNNEDLSLIDFGSTGYS